MSATEARRAPAYAEVEAPAQARKWGFAEVFIISQTALPALLYLPGSQAFRLPIRFSAFAISLGAFAWYQIESTSQAPRSAMQGWITAIMALLAVMLFHPETSSMLGGIAHMAVYFAVMAPLFWAPEFVKTPEQIARILWILLLCSGANAVVGVLQVYDPARWLPAEFSRIVTANQDMMGSVTYIGANGQRVVRPPGLFDTPGAVAGPAMFAALLGLVFAVSAIPIWKRAISLGVAGAGLAAIYLSQVRVSLVCTVVMMSTYALVSLRQGRAARASQFGILAGGIVVVSLSLAVALGGAAITERVNSLFASAPIDVYQGARGSQLSFTFYELLFQYPLGAGLGRWGMASGYFGSASATSPPIWAEIQFTGWMIDGGALMIAIYMGALVTTTLTQYQIAQATQYPRLAVCAAVILAAGLGPFLMIVSFTPFVAQIGIQYWFLAGALHGVACRYGVRPAA
jgi:hypothetical protein